jgi:hypothetical protein
MALASTTINKYLKQYAEPDITDLRLSRCYQQVLVIPAFDETWENICSVWNTLEGHFLCIIVVNSASHHPITEQLFQACLKSGKLLGQGRNWYHVQGKPDLLIFDRCTPGYFVPHKQGVGLARKIGADAALKLINLKNVGTHQINITDADAQLPEQYFQHRLAPSEAALLHPYYHQTRADESPKYRQATLLYELKLYYYVRGLKHANSPYAFHSLGSTIVVNPLNYAQVRGFPKRSAAEDFYLLNKLRKTGQLRQLSSAAIKLSARPSTRVPIGTGQGILKLIGSTDALQSQAFYNPQIFDLLKTFLIVLETSWLQAPELSKLDQRLANYAQQEVLQTKIGHLRNRCNSHEVFRKAILEWFDGFRTLKLIHFLRDQDLPDVSAINLVQVPWLSEPEGVTTREMTLLKKLGVSPATDIVS